MVYDLTLQPFSNDFQPIAQDVAALSWLNACNVQPDQLRCVFRFLWKTLGPGTNRSRRYYPPCLLASQAAGC